MAEPTSPAPDRLRLPDGLWRRRVASFGHAGRGVWSALRSEVHLRFHALATVVVIGLGLYCHITRLEWALVAIAVACVWSAELMNTAIEALTDLASPAWHPLAGKAKDVAAGAVLLAALGALVVGALVFGPYFFNA
ncbi:diacylglycerol kinase family protein [Hymenobacter negativus]|uniref:diacylglycerol kinase family protein n=1 Tax=Hymenobacter negativus TaxID=2795026 RepID=UPI00293D7A1F|nr:MULTISPECIES: diacylglycerol kinase family protein [Bacteria]